MEKEKKPVFFVANLWLHVSVNFVLSFYVENARGERETFSAAPSHTDTPISYTNRFSAFIYSFTAKARDNNKKNGQCFGYFNTI